MSDALRTNLATRLLTCTLPDGDVAAEMLLSADIETPVKMVTPPNPARCQQLIRGPFVKAATLAMSTDDPATLEKLARHASLGVKLAVVKNPAATDTARRIVEVAALKRADNEMLQGVLEGAELGYILDALEDQARAARIVSNANRTGKLYKVLTDPEKPVDGSVFQRLLEFDQSGLAEVIGKAVGANWPCAVNIPQLASMCSSDPKLEAKFLSSFISSVAVFDDTAAEALERVACLRPDLVNKENTSLVASLAAVQMTDRGRQSLMSTCLGTAKAAYAIEQSTVALEQIAERYGTNHALASAMMIQPREDRVRDIVGWLTLHLDVVGSEYGQTGFEHQAASWMIPHIADDGIVAKVLSKTPRATVIHCLNGQLGTIEASRYKLLARTFPGDVLRQLRHISDPVMRAEIAHEAFSAAEVMDILSHFNYMESHLDNEMLVDLIRRIANSPEIQDPSSRILYNTRVMRDALIRESFVAYIDDPATDGETLLWWLRLARERGLTLGYLAGRRGRKLTDQEVESMIQNPGEAFGGPMVQTLVRFFSEFNEMLPRDVLDKLVDAAGAPVLAQMNSGNGQNIYEYLARRLADEGLDNEEWTTAFELLAKSPASIGAAITAAKRLVRASRVKLGN
jgi:hypothetical protein